MQRTRNFCWTLNNYTVDDIIYLDTLECRYIQYGYEKAPTTGTPHLQGFTVFENPRTLKAAIKVFPAGTHVEMCRGTAEQNMKYTKKDGDNVYERGDRPMSQAEKGLKGEEYWRDIEIKLKEFRDDELPPSFTIGNERSFERLKYKRFRDTPKEDVETKHRWYYGPTRTGKSRKAREGLSSDQLYLKKLNKWWDGYTGQDIVLLEDIDDSHKYMLHDLKIWADRYAFPAEIKGGMIQLRPKLIIVTSNYAIQDIWPLPRENEPLLQRFEQTEFK